MSKNDETDNKLFISKLNLFLEQYRKAGFLPNVEDSKNINNISKLENIDENKLDEYDQDSSGPIKSWDNFWNNNWHNWGWSKGLW